METTFSKLIINEPPLQVLPSLAKVLGLEQAIIVQQIHYLWIQRGNGKVLEDGEKYIWNTAKEFHEDYFSFMQPDSIRKYLRGLELDGVLICRTPDKVLGNPRKYYRIDYARLNEIFDLPENLPILPENLPILPANFAGSYTKNPTKTSTHTGKGGRQFATDDLSDPIKIVYEVFEIMPGINSQDAINSLFIEDLNLWRETLMTFKAGCSDAEWNAGNYKQKAIQYAMTNYRTALGRKQRFENKTGAAGGKQSRSDRLREAGERAKAKV